MSKLFGNNNDRLSEADRLVNEDIYDAEDRTTLQSFYNGQPTMTEEDAKDTGTTNIVNHLLGYDSIATGQRQVESIYCTGKYIWHIELYDMPEGSEHLKSKWEACIREAFNGAIRKSRRFKPEWKALSGEIVLFGNGSLYFKDNYDWCPVMARPYVPRGTGTLVDDLTHFSIADFINLHELKTALRCAEKREEMGVECNWNMRSLRTLIDMLEGNFRQPTTGPSNVPSNQTPEERDDEYAINAQGSLSYTTRVPVYYFYEQSDDGKRWELRIIPRITKQQSDVISKSSEPLPDVIYTNDNVAESIRHLLHPFFIDCKIGGKQLWHKVMGLGRLNYDSDVEVEEMFNDAMSGARENMRRLYAVKTVADWELVKSWASGTGPANTLPPGVEIADVGRQPNFQHAMGPMQLLMQLTRRNAATVNITGAGDQGQQNELEVNALERQSRNAETLAARMNDVYEHTDALGYEIFRRFLCEDILETDPGYNEIKKFQDYLREEKVSLPFLRKMKNGDFVNVCVKTNRAAGDGNTVKKAMANAALIARLPMFSGEAQQIILRKITAEENDDYNFAEEVVPYEPGKDTNQVVVANQENDICDKQGIIGVVPQLNKDDIDLTHIPEHFKSMQADVARGKVRPWDQIDLAAFMAKGSHCAMHIQKIKANKANGELANQLMQQLQKIAKEGQEFANNLNKQNQAASTPMSEKDRASLEIQARNQNLKERAQIKLEEHRADALELSREKSAITNANIAHQGILQEEGQAHKQMIDRAQTVLDAQKVAQDGAALQAQQAQQAAAPAQPTQPAPPAGNDNEPTA